MAEESENARARLLISGRVQGVFYRASTQREASQLGLTGWVRNLPDGSVEALVEGPENRLRDLIRWCRQGPTGARVDEVEIAWEEFRGAFDDFRITY